MGALTRIKDMHANATEEGEPTTVQLQSVKPQQSNGADVSSHEVESPSTVDLELTESASTGEVPSPITFRLVHPQQTYDVCNTIFTLLCPVFPSALILLFYCVFTHSMGEFGSRRKPDETFLTTCTEFGTLGQSSVLLQDASCGHHENLESFSANDGGSGGSPTGGACGTDEGSSDSPQDDDNEAGKGRKEEGGGRRENGEEDEKGDGGGSGSEHVRAGGDGGGSSDHGESSSSEKDLTSLSSNSNMTDISTTSEHLEPGHSPREKENPTQLPCSEANEVHRERPLAEQQPGSSPKVAMDLQPGAQLTDSEPQFTAPSFVPSVRNRHISGATTTITTDFSDGQPTQGPITTKAHTLEPFQPAVGGLVQGPPVVPESSVTTGSSEKEMRKLGYRNKAGEKT